LYEHSLQVVRLPATSRWRSQQINEKQMTATRYKK
jgi:hypothetical protein